MKELSIEQKAKAYDEALAKAKEQYNYPCMRSCMGILEDIFPELVESEGENIRKWCISHFKECINVIKDNDEYKEYLSNKVLAWLERQGEHANFRNKIQIGDKVTRNEDGVLVNLSQLQRVAKKDEKQGEQKPAWSDEDEKMFDYALDMVEWYSGKNEDKSRLVSNWLKSLRHQNRWKPSDEQMRILDLAIRGGINHGTREETTLVSLLNDLKKLKEGKK